MGELVRFDGEVKRKFRKLGLTAILFDPPQKRPRRNVSDGGIPVMRRFDLLVCHKPVWDTVHQQTTAPLLTTESYG